MQDPLSDVVRQFTEGKAPGERIDWQGMAHAIWKAERAAIAPVVAPKPERKQKADIVGWARRLWGKKEIA